MRFSSKRPQLLCALLTHLLIQVPAYAENANAGALDIKQQSVDKKTRISIPSAPNRQRAANIVDGKVLITRIELKGDSLFPQYGVTQAYIYQRLKDAYSKLDPWMTISDMHSLADSLTIAYHEKGLTFNQVFVVPSEIRGNTLSVNVLAGRVSEIHLKNNKLYSSSQIKQPFLHLLGEVVYEPDIQDAMKKANMIPGLKVFGFFSMGKHPGQTRLNLHVLKETKHFVAIRMDNFGVNNTGVHRLIGQYSQNNVSGKGDTLSSTVISTEEVGNLFGALAYKTPFDNGDYIGASVYSNQFEITGEFEALGMSGHLEALSGFVDLNLMKEDNAIAALNATASYKNSVIKSNEFQDILGEETRYATLDGHFTAAVIHPNGKSRQSIGLKTTIGGIIESNNEEINDLVFTQHIQYGYQYRWIAGNPQEFVSSFDSAVHFSPSVLPSSERSVLTGPYAVRSYQPGLFSADSVVTFLSEQSFKNVYFSDRIKALPFVFMDYAYGQQQYDEKNTASFLGVGAGVELNYKTLVNGRLTLGIPIQESVSQELSEQPDSAIFYGAFSIHF